MTKYQEQTYIMIKPDGVQRALVGTIIARFEQRGFKLVAMKMMKPSQKLLENHYCDLKDKPFFPSLVDYMMSGPVVCMVWEGFEAVKTGRVLLGATKPSDSLPGTIRGDFCQIPGRNLIHGSDAVASAHKEIAMWFSPNELQSYNKSGAEWIHE